MMIFELAYIASTSLFPFLDYLHADDCILHSSKVLQKEHAFEYSTVVKIERECALRICITLVCLLSNIDLWKSMNSNNNVTSRLVELGLKMMD